MIQPTEAASVQALVKRSEKAFEASELGKELEGKPTRFVIGEIWKQGWNIGWLDCMTTEGTD